MQFGSRAVVCILLLSISSCTSSIRRASTNQEETLSTIDHAGVLRVGYIVFPPCVSKNQSTGTLSGHCIATVEEIAHEANWRIDYIETTWATFPVDLESHRFDLSIAPTFVTIPRAKAVSFTTPLFYAGNSAIIRKGDTRFVGLEDMDKAGIRIAVTAGEAGDEYAHSHFKNATISVHSGSDQALTFQDVLSNRADIALGDAYVTSQFAKIHPTEVVDMFANSPYNLTPVSWSVRHADLQFLSFIDASLEALDSQGKLMEYERIAGAHWLHPKQIWEKQ